MNTLKIENLSHSYKDGQKKVEALKNVSLEFKSGKVYTVIGESGSGKTTLISLIAALDEIQKGDVLFNDESIKKIGQNKFRLKFVSIVFQSYNLIKYMTARENVEIALDFAGVKAGEKRKAYELLESVGIDKDTADRLVLKLSGGEQQRVAIARCLASDTQVVVADEPTGNLDNKTAENILELFGDLAKHGKIVIIVTHSEKPAKQLNAEIIKME